MTRPVTAETLTMAHIATVLRQAKASGDDKLRRRCERLERHDGGPHYFNDLEAVAAAINARGGK